MGRNLKRRCLAWITAFTMMAGLFMGNVSELIVKADSMAASVTIGYTSLETGWYVKASDATAAGSGIPVDRRGVDKVDEQPQSGGYFYFDKDTAAMTVYNDMEIEVNGPTPVTVSNGTLTISGSGNLTITGTAPAFQFSGTAPSVVTENYTGNFKAKSVNLIVRGSGTGTFDIQTTGNITLETTGSSAPAFSTITTVTLNGKEVSVTAGGGQIDNGLTNLNWTQSQGDIRLTTSSFTPIFTAANLKIKTENGKVALQSTAGVALTISNNIDIEASGDIDINTSNGLSSASGGLSPIANLEVKLVSQNGNVKIDGNNNSVMPEGKLNIQAPEGKVDISATSSTPMIQAELDIKAKNDITLNQKGTDGASLTWGGTGGSIESTNGNILIKQSGSAQVVATRNTVSLNAEGNITVQRAIAGSYDIVSAIPATGVIQLIDGSNKITVIDGTVYSAAGCTHPRRVNGKCVVCDDQEPVAVVTEEDGSTTEYDSLISAFRAANGNNTVKLLLDYKNSSEVIDLSSSYNEVNLDLNNHSLEVNSFHVSNKLSVSNGKMKAGSLSNSNTGHNDTMFLNGVEAEIHDISWTANGGLKLKESKLNVGSQTTRCSFFVEMITIAENDDSIITVQNMITGLANYGNVPEMKEALEKLVPLGYSVYVNTSSATGSEITAADESGSRARNLVLRNKRLAEADITLNPGTFVYDGTAKEPAVTVMYDGATLTEGTDYIVTYSNNINVSDYAAATISGSAFRDSVTKYFSITKANRNAPTGLVAVAETIDGKNDGKIRNVDSGMEYSMDGTAYTVISSNELTGLSDGTYLVRYKETQNYYASPVTQVIVEKGIASSGSINPPGQNGGTTSGGDLAPSGNGAGSGTTDASVPTASSVQNAATASGNTTIKTGDENQVFQYWIMLICAAGVGAGAYYKVKSRKLVKK